jgi:flagellar hook-associated protein 3 FlgL
MRVTQTEIYRSLLSDIENLNETLSRVSRQVSSSKKLTQLMDSPAASAEIVSLSEEATEIDQYLSNIDTGSFFLQTADSTLNEVHNLVSSIYTRGSQSASESVNPDSRAALAADIRTLRDQIFSLANTQARGRYIFAGSRIQAAPFTISGDTVSYVGNSAVNKVSVEDGVEIPESVSGSNAFNTVFSAISTLLTAMDGNDVPNIKAALLQFSSALSDLGQARAQIGSNLGALEIVKSSLNSKDTNLTERRSKLEDADLAAAVVQLSQNQNALQAAIASGGSILSQRNLFDILG